MAAHKLIKFIKEKSLGIKPKTVLSLSVIAAVLLLSSVISMMEYQKMSSYVSDLIAKDINCINMARKLGDVTNEYNLDILALIGDDSITTFPDFDASAFMAHCDSLNLAIDLSKSLADSLKYSYSAYMLTSLELGDVYESDFIDTRDWYFERLQPRYNRMRSDIDQLSSAIYEDLRTNSEEFDKRLYRSIIPGIVAVGVGLLLILMLMYFMLYFYVNPIYKMLDAMKSYRSYGRKYAYDFDGDDQLRELNSILKDVSEENLTLRKRIAALKNNECKGDN